MRHTALTVAVVLVCGALAGAGALVLARGRGPRRLLGALPGLVALAAATALEASGGISRGQLLAGTAAVVVVAVLVTFAAPRPEGPKSSG